MVAVVALVLGAALLLLGSGFPRLSSFFTAWLSFGVLLYFLQAVEGVGQTLSLCLAALLPPPLLAAPIALLPLPVSSSLWGAYVGFVCWLGFHTLYPDALASSPAGLYLLLALPSAAFGAVAAAFSRHALVVCTPVVGVFLLYQGLTTFIHQPWPLLFALDQQPTCQHSTACYVGFAVALLAAAVGVAWQFAWTAMQAKRADAALGTTQSKGASIPLSAATLAAVVGGGGAVAASATDSTVVPLHSAEQTLDVEMVSRSTFPGSDAVVVLIPSSPSARGQHVLVEDAPSVPAMAYPTAPVPLLLPHASHAHSRRPSHPPTTAAAAAVMGPARWGTEPVMGGGETAGGAEVASLGCDEDEETGGSAETGGRRWGSHVSVGSRQRSHDGETLTSPVPQPWVAVYSYDDQTQDEPQSSHPFSPQQLGGTLSLTSGSSRQPGAGDGAEEERWGEDAAADDHFLDRSPASSAELPPPLTYGSAVGATMSDAGPAALTVHEGSDDES